MTYSGPPIGIRLRRRSQTCWAWGSKNEPTWMRNFWKTARSIKAVHRRVSLADCCALALARRLGARLVSGRSARVRTNSLGRHLPNRVHSLITNAATFPESRQLQIPPERFLLVPSVGLLSVFRRPLYMIDHQDFHRPLGGRQF